MNALEHQGDYCTNLSSCSKVQDVYGVPSQMVFIKVNKLQTRRRKKKAVRESFVSLSFYFPSYTYQLRTLVS
jgi:hypothetical protein